MGPAPSGVSQVDPAEPVEVAVDLGATRGAEPAGAGTGGAEPGVSVSGGAASGGAEPGRVEPEGTASGGTEPSRAESCGALGVVDGAGRVKHRLEHRTKHIALRYFLARELQQRGQLLLAYMASRASTADVFTKALQPCDH
ncbi:unnamed protein product [Closterium sp. NIES-54]